MSLLKPYRTEMLYGEYIIKSERYRKLEYSYCRGCKFLYPGNPPGIALEYCTADSEIGENISGNYCATKPYRPVGKYVYHPIDISEVC